MYKLYIYRYTYKLISNHVEYRVYPLSKPDMVIIIIILMLGKLEALCFCLFD